jgi:branched-chain amino acid transport system ATP-binding protein
MGGPMQAIFGPSLGVFIGLTVVLIGGASILTGRAMAEGWRPWWHLALAAVGLGIADRFLTYAMFQGRFLDPLGFVVHYIILLALGLLAFRIAQAGKMVRQYPWRYERSGLFTFREKSST